MKLRGGVCEAIVASTATCIRLLTDTPRFFRAILFRLHFARVSGGNLANGQWQNFHAANTFKLKISLLNDIAEAALGHALVFFQ